MEEYDYLEAQLNEAKPKAVDLPPPPIVEDLRPAERPREERDGERDGKKRSRSRSREHRHRSSSRRDEDRGRERRRSRSRDRDGRRRDDRERRRSRSRERDYRDRPRDRDFDRRGREERRGGHPKPRDRTPPEVRLQREKEQELRDLERTVRTVMVMNLNLRAGEKDIFDHFCNVGGINDIRLICDKNTKKSKGICYIEFSTVESAITALTLNGTMLMGMPVLVKPSEAEKNLAWEAQQQAKLNQAASMNLLNKMGGTVPGVKVNPIKLQILNLHPDISEEDLKDLFAPFGEINYVSVVRDPSGVSTGEAYVQYADEPMASAAIKHFNGFEIAGKQLTVQVAPLYSGIPAAVLPPMPGAPGAPGALPMPPGLQPPEPPTQGVNEVDDLDEAENKSFRLNAQSRAALMSRLATSAGLQAPPTLLMPGGQTPAATAAAAQPAGPVLTVPQQVLLEQGLLGPASPIPTPCILLKNMFSDSDKTDPNWEEDVAEDVKSEAAKFGPVLHCKVDPNSKGHVYLKFQTQQAAEAASRALHGRYYSGNQIVVSYQFLQPYNAYFKCA